MHAEDKFNQIRSLPDDLKHIPILGITASSKHAVTALQAGMNDLLQKPFTMTQFFDAMWNCIGVQGVQSEKQWFMERIPAARYGQGGLPRDGNPAVVWAR